MYYSLRDSLSANILRLKNHISLPVQAMTHSQLLSCTHRERQQQELLLERQESFYFYVCKSPHACRVCDLYLLPFYQPRSSQENVFLHKHSNWESCMYITQCYVFLLKCVHSLVSFQECVCASLRSLTFRSLMTFCYFVHTISDSTAVGMTRWQLWPCLCLMMQ